MTITHIYHQNTNFYNWYESNKRIIKELFGYYHNFISDNELFINVEDNIMYRRFVRFIFKHSTIYIHK